MVLRIFSSTPAGSCGIWIGRERLLLASACRLTQYLTRKKWYATIARVVATIPAIEIISGVTKAEFVDWTGDPPPSMADHHLWMFSKLILNQNSWCYKWANAENFMFLNRDGDRLQCGNTWVSSNRDGSLFHFWAREIQGECKVGILTLENREVSMCMDEVLDMCMSYSYMVWSFGQVYVLQLHGIMALERHATG